MQVLYLINLLATMIILFISNNNSGVHLMACFLMKYAGPFNEEQDKVAIKKDRTQSKMIQPDNGNTCMDWKNIQRKHNSHTLRFSIRLLTWIKSVQVQLCMAEPTYF